MKKPCVKVITDRLNSSWLAKALYYLQALFSYYFSALASQLLFNLSVPQRGKHCRPRFAVSTWKWKKSFLWAILDVSCRELLRSDHQLFYHQVSLPDLTIHLFSGGRNPFWVCTGGLSKYPKEGASPPLGRKSYNKSCTSNKMEHLCRIVWPSDLCGLQYKLSKFNQSDRFHAVSSTNQRTTTPS